MIVKKFVPSVVLIVLFVLLVHGYNQWVGLGQLYLVRRTVAALGLGVLLFGPAIVLRRQFLYLTIMSTLVSALFIVQFLYTSYAGGFLSISALKYLGQVESLGSGIKTLIGPQLLFFLTPLAVMAVLTAIRPRPAAVAPLARVARIWIIVAIFGLPLLSAGYVAAGEIREQGNIKVLTEHPYNSDELVRKVGIIDYALFDVVKYALRKKTLTPDEREFVLKNRDQYEFKPEGTVGFGQAAGKNVIYLQLESFQEFVIGRQVNGQVITPNLNKLAADSLQFTNFHYMIGPGTSSDAEFTALNSLIYPGDSAAFFEYPNNRYHALPQTLQESGYSTTAMHGDSRNFWNRINIYPALGYQQFLGIESFKPTEPGLPWGLTDKDFFEQTPAKLADLKQPYYAHLISLSSHLPFVLPAKDQQLNMNGVALTKVQQDYLQAVHYTDAMLGAFLDTLRARGDLAHTLLVVTGDHEGFIAGKTDQQYAQFLGYANGFDDLNFLQSKQVPLLIYADGLAPRQVGDPGSQLDIYPTITNLLGIKTPSSVLGKDLLNTEDNLVVRRRRATGIDLEFVKNRELTYVGSEQSSQFESGSCYRLTAKVSLADCRALYQLGYNKVKLSDLVVKGNVLDLLK